MRLFPPHCGPAFPWLKEQATTLPKLIFGYRCLPGRGQSGARTPSSLSVLPLKRQTKSPRKQTPWESSLTHFGPGISVLQAGGVMLKMVIWGVLPSLSQLSMRLLTLAQIMISRLWDRALLWALRLQWSLLETLPLPSPTHVHFFHSKTKNFKNKY